jgi:hypothetical protein
MIVGTDAPSDAPTKSDLLAVQPPDSGRAAQLRALHFTLPVGHAAGPPGYDETLRELTERVFSFFEDHLGISDTSQSARSTK